MLPLLPQLSAIVLGVFLKLISDDLSCLIPSFLLHRGLRMVPNRAWPSWIQETPWMTFASDNSPSQESRKLTLFGLV